MTSEQVQGRRITFVIACWACLPSVFIPLMLPLMAYSLSTGGVLFRVIVPPVMAWFLLRRKAWARYLTVVLFSLAASVIAIRLLLEGGGSRSGYLAGGVAAVLHLVAATTLYASKSVDAFFNGEGREAGADLSGT